VPESARADTVRVVALYLRFVGRGRLKGGGVAYEAEGRTEEAPRRLGEGRPELREPFQEGQPYLAAGHPELLVQL
jgi:hypothetical protein